MQTHNNQGSSFTNTITRFWFKYSPFWPLFLFICALCIGGAWYYLQYEKPVYFASASILIKDQKRGYDDPKVIEDLDPVATKKSLDNEIGILKSQSIMTNVVKNIGLYVQIYEEGKFIPRLAYRTSPVTVIHNNPDSIINTGKVYFTYDDKNAKVIIDNNKFPLNEWVKTNYGILQFKPNPNYNKVAEKPLYFTITSPSNLAFGFTANLKITPATRSSNIVNMNIKDEDPKRAENILNEIVNAYNQTAFTDKQRLAANTLAFVDERLNHVSKELDSIERKVQNYKARQMAVDISAQGAQYLGNIGSNDQKLTDVNLQLAVLDQVQGYVMSKDNKGGIVPSTLGVNDGMLSQLLNNLYEKELEYERLKKTMAENHPNMLSISDQINKIKPSILENIQNQKKSLQLSRNNIYATTNRFTSKLQNIPQKERELIEVSRDQMIKNGIYSFLLQKREETALSYAAEAPESKIIDKAVGFGPVSSSTTIYLISIGIAFLLFLGIVTGKELLTPTILYRHEIESATSFPIIGEISFKELKNQLITDQGGKTFVAEQFRKLRASLTFLGIDSKRKKILVTSTISGEGKSFITANLGISLAMAGKKVVSLELDLINPALSEKLMVKSDKGISDYLSGKCEPEEIIKRTEVHENLFVIPSGSYTDNPSELIMNKKVKELLDYLDGIFDFILIDTSPVGPTTDGYILSSYCDATLYVVRHKYTPKLFVQRIDDENKINQLKNAAIVFNGVKPRGFSKSSFGYGYGYGYEYVYKEKKSKGKVFVVRKNQ